MTKTDIIEKVRKIMNEAGAEETLTLLSEDTVKLDVYIESVIPDAASMLSLIVPTSFLNATSSNPSIQNGIFSLPADYSRLAALKLTTWKRPVFKTVNHESNDYKAQSNPLTASGVSKPCCATGFNSSGATMECYPSGTIEYFYYIKSINTADEAVQVIKDGLNDSLCYMCSSLVYDIFENQQTAERMKAIAISLIPKNNEVEAG